VSERYSYLTWTDLADRLEAAEAEVARWRTGYAPELQELETLQTEVARLRHACDYAIHELGVPQDELTPAPVANAYRVLVAALGEDA